MAYHIPQKSLSCTSANAFLFKYIVLKKHFPLFPKFYATKVEFSALMAVFFSMLLTYIFLDVLLFELFHDNVFLICFGRFLLL